jgi:hypothetical protein
VAEKNITETNEVKDSVNETAKSESLSREDIERAIKQAKLEGLEAGRSEAKQQLYSKLESQDKELKQLKKQLETTVSSSTDFQNKLKQSLGMDTTAEEPSIEEILAQKDQVFEEKLKGLMDSFDEKLKSSEERINYLNQQHIENLKEKIVAENNGKIIKGLLTGNTEEEIRSKIDEAKAAYDSVAEQLKNELTASSREERKGKQLPSTSEVSSGNVGEIKDETLEDKVLNSSDEDFKANMSLIEQELKKAFNK